MLHLIDQGNSKQLTGTYPSEANKNLIFKEKPSHLGLYLGTISKYNKNKGLVTCKLEDNLSVGDSISFENENAKYTVSELMENNENIKTATPLQKVTFGRMKGNINLRDKIYKIKDKALSDIAISSYSKENIKTSLDCKLTIKKDSNIFVNIYSNAFDINIDYTYNYIPPTSQNAPLTKEKIINQFTKTLDTPFVFEHFDIELDDNLFMPVSILNEIRRLRNR